MLDKRKQRYRFYWEKNIYLQYNKIQFYPKWGLNPYDLAVKGF